MSRKLYLDLDGVMADFDYAFTEQTGCFPSDLSDDELWEAVYKNPTFFADLPMCPGAADFFQFLLFYKLDPIICTACPKSKYETVALQKREWVRRNLSDDLMVLPVMGGRNKWLFMHKPGDILIDDFQKNIVRWNDAGGVGILHKGDFEATKAAVRALVLPAALAA